MCPDINLDLIQASGLDRQILFREAEILVKHLMRKGIAPPDIYDVIFKRSCEEEYDEYPSVEFKGDLYEVDLPMYN